MKFAIDLKLIRTAGSGHENWSELPVVSFPFIRIELSGSAPKS
jgi:hypothetical protein